MGAQVAAMLATFLAKMERSCGVRQVFQESWYFCSNFDASGFDFGSILGRPEPILDRFWVDFGTDVIEQGFTTSSSIFSY